MDHFDTTPVFKSGRETFTSSGSRLKPISGTSFLVIESSFRVRNNFHAELDSIFQPLILTRSFYLLSPIERQYILSTAMRRKTLTFSNGLSLKNHKDGRPTLFQYFYSNMEILKLFTVPFTYINRLDGHTTPRPYRIF